MGAWNIAWSMLTTPVAKHGSVIEAGGRGILSAFLPIEASPGLLETESEIASREAQIALKRKYPRAQASHIEKIELSAYEKLTSVGTRNIVRKGGRLFSKWIGPVMVAGRLATEATGKGFTGNIDAGARIVGEEASYAAGSAIGMVAGSAIMGTQIGMAIGGALGSVVPGAGNILGMAIGAGIGLIIGAVGSYAWNKFVDAAEVPFKVAKGGWNYLKSAGKRSTMMELGGRTSYANSTGIAYTMRQRALGQMNRSGINARSLLGNEASYMHIR